MTLSVAAVFPWGALAQLRGQGINVPQAVVFLTDSRWTIMNSARPALDIGRKLFPIAKDAAAVYAGDVEGGEYCIEQLAWEIGRSSSRNGKHFLRIAEDTFKRTYADLKRRRMQQRKELHPLYILIGACRPEGVASLSYLSSESKFVPKPLTGVCAIGAPQARQAFAAALNGEAQKNKGMFDTSTAVDGWAGKLATLLSSQVITSSADTTVGGKVQLGLIDKNGFRHVHIARTPIPFPSQTRPKWEWITAGKDDLVAFATAVASGVLSAADLQPHQIAE